MLTKFVNLFKGTVSVKIISSQCEQILNVAHRNGVNFWKLKRIDGQKIKLKIFEKDLRTLQTICIRYQADCKVLFYKSMGVFYKKYRRRWGLLVGAVLSLLIFGILNCFIWDIKVSGCEEKTTENEIIRKFNDLGIGFGKKRFGIDISAIENEFLLKNEDVFWVSINMRFTTVYIELREKTGKEIEIQDLTTPCDIYAARDGQIISMITTSGTPLVKVGDSVCAGDKLVSREYIDRYGQSIIVHAMATIKAKTVRKLETQVPLYENIHLPSGKKKSFYTLNLFNLKIPLYFNKKISYNNYDITNRKNVLKVGDFALPFSIQANTYTDIKIVKKQVPYERAKMFALAELTSNEKEFLFNTEIVSKTIKEKRQDETLILTAEYQCIEDIAYTDNRMS